MEPTHYILHVCFGLVAGASFVFIFWSLAMARWQRAHGTYSQEQNHIIVARVCTLIVLAMLVATIAIPARAQYTPPTTRQHDPMAGFWHELPPPMNIVNGGYLMEHSATTHRDATYVALAGLAAGAVLATENQRVGMVVGGMALGYSIRLQFRSTKSQRMAGQLFQLGYRAEYLYDIVPDSIDAHPHLRVIPK